MVSTAVTIHAINIQPGLSISRAISAETMKIPEPIMVPITTMVESNRFRPRTNPASEAGSVVCDASADMRLDSLSMLQGAGPGRCSVPAGRDEAVQLRMPL